MRYRLILRKKAKKFIDHLEQKERERVVAAIEKLPQEGDIKRMRGHLNLMRLRVGDYRILYTVDKGQCIILLIDAGYRGDIYKMY